ncbi:hypothetical protein WCD74_18545 [Actinomycetospora sp. OC33-EN08]|uniref:Uncharacterized protein n=1 Tax=Actinomycetospora aurantiaca TaxID=3129233 RepID=A0ABU8MS16_9PSEU
MASPVQASLILCDAATAEPTSGKVNMLGAGWSVTSSPTGPQAVAVLIKIPWDRTNQQIPLRLQLMTTDGAPVRLEQAEGDGRVGAEAHVEAGRPPGTAPGSHISAAFVLNVAPLPLPAGRYEWRLEIDGDTVAVADFTALA